MKMRLTIRLFLILKVSSKTPGVWYTSIFTSGFDDSKRGKWPHPRFISYNPGGDKEEQCTFRPTLNANTLAIMARASPQYSSHVCRHAQTRRN